MKEFYLVSIMGFFRRSMLTRFLILFNLVFFLRVESVHAQLSLSNASPSATIDFSASMPVTVGTNTGTAFSGAGFSPNPTNANSGRLNSNAWAVTGFDDGTLNYGGTQLSNDFGRGSVNTSVTVGGIYAYTGSPNSALNPALMIQSAADNFVPGAITLRIQNNGSTIIKELAVSYNLYVRNDQGRSSSFNFSYSTDNSNYTALPALDYTSIAVGDALGWVMVPGSPSRSTNITGLYIAPTSYIYIRWSGSDAGGSGSRDEIGLDDINVAATYGSPCTPPVTNASFSAATNVYTSQMDVNFTRGSGTGGLLIVASTTALSSNPISGLSYTANSFYGSGAPIGNGYVVYNSNAVPNLTAGTFTLTGLSPGQTYYLNAFEYNVTIPCYVTTGATLTQNSAATSVTQATDAFRSKNSGNWANLQTWESFTAGAWISADLAPTSTASTIDIRASHIVDISNSVSMDEVLVNGTLTLSVNGIINLNNGTGNDFIVQNGGVFQVLTNQAYASTMMTSVGAQYEVATGGKIRIGNGGITSATYHLLAATSGLVIWNDASIFEWNTTNTFNTSGVTYFPDAAPNIIPIFRVSTTTGFNVGASTATTWKGLIELNVPLNFDNSGTKTFRNGLIGTGNLTQLVGCGQIIINGTTAKLGGSGALNLYTNGLAITTNSVVSITSDKVINATAGLGTLTVSSGCSLYCDASVLSGTALFSMLGSSTLRLGHAGGISSSGATGNIQLSGARTFSTTGNYIYNGTSNQVTGNGLPTTIASLQINNTGLVSNNTVSLTTSLTTSPVLTLTAGLFAAGIGQQLNISSGGTVTAVAGNFASGSTAGILNFAGAGTFAGTCSPYDVYASGVMDFGLGTVTIQNGGSFRINAGGSVVLNRGPYYATGSNLVYNTGGAFSIGSEWITNVVLPTRGGPHHVTALASGTALSFGALVQAKNMRGDLVLSSGTSLSLSTSGGGDLVIGGNWTRAATALFTNNARKVTFDGTLNQTITVTGGGSENFGFLKLSKTTGTLLVLAASPNATSISINGNPASIAPSYTLEWINGDIELNQNSINFSSWNGNQNNIQVDGITGNLSRLLLSTGGAGYFNIYNSDAAEHTVTISRVSLSSTRRSVFQIGVNVVLTNGAIVGGSSGINFGTFSTTAVTQFNGSFRLDAGGFVSTNAPLYLAGSSLIYNTGATFNRNLEWSATTGVGYPHHVILQGNTALTLNFPNTNGDADRAIGGSLTIGNGSSLLLATTAANKLTIGEHLVINGGLTLPLVAGGDLYLAGNWTRSSTGTFTANDRTVYLNSNLATVISANAGEQFAGLHIGKSSSLITVSLNDPIRISKEFTINTGVFDLVNNSVTLQSNVTETASLGKFGVGGALNYSGTGRFIVERFIPTAIGSAPYHQKGWQLLAIPVNNAGAVGGQTIQAGWQEGNAPLVTGTPNRGTIISSNIAGAGFDIVGGTGPSMKTYDAGTASWLGVPNTTGTELYNPKGYMLFVRGDRSVVTYNGTATETTLRAAGKIMEPANLPPTITVGSSLFESVGNPYASAIDFSNETGVVKSATIQRVFYVWDPRLNGTYGYGAYQTFTKGAGTDYTVSPGGGSYGAGGSVHNVLESGQAFLVAAGVGGGTINFNEEAKISGSRLVTRLGIPAQREKQIRTNLFFIDNNNRILVDGVLSEFHRKYDSKLDLLDARKLNNSGENLGINSHTNLLVVERRGELENMDSIEYQIANLKIGQYALAIIPTNIRGTYAFLHDAYLQVDYPVNLTDTCWYSFSVDQQEGSSAADRFKLIFKKINHLNKPIVQNIQEKKRVVSINYKKMQPNPEMYVTPNPVKNKQIILSIVGDATDYQVFKVINNEGRIVFSKEVSFPKGMNRFELQLPEYIATGTYHLLVYSKTRKTINLAIFVD